jgi:hypothetical protein
VHDYRLEKWRELHICSDYKNNNGPSRSSINSTSGSTWFYREEVGCKEGIVNSLIVAGLIVVDREEDLE